jgi:hypothetical protein
MPDSRDRISAKLSPASINSPAPSVFMYTQLPLLPLPKGHTVIVYFLPYLCLLFAKSAPKIAFFPKRLAARSFFEKFWRYTRQIFKSDNAVFENAVLEKRRARFLIPFNAVNKRVIRKRAAFGLRNPDSQRLYLSILFSDKKSKTIFTAKRA